MDAEREFNIAVEKYADHLKNKQGHFSDPFDIDRRDYMVRHGLNGTCRQCGRYLKLENGHSLLYVDREYPMMTYCYGCCGPLPDRDICSGCNIM